MGHGSPWKSNSTKRHRRSAGSRLQESHGSKGHQSDAEGRHYRLNCRADGYFNGVGWPGKQELEYEAQELVHEVQYPEARQDYAAREKT